MTDPFIRRWFSEGGLSFLGLAGVMRGETVALPLTQLLAIPENDLSEFGEELLNLSVSDPFGAAIEEFRAGVQAYLQFQDLLEVWLEPDTPFENRHYPYYESVTYLRETAIAILGRQALAAFVLIRPTLELAVTHLYFQHRARDQGYGEYYDWLAGKKGKPPFRTMLDWLMDQVPAGEHVWGQRYQLLRSVLINLYRHSCTYHHPPAQKESVTVLGGGVPGSGPFPFIYALTDINMMLRQLCYLYVLSFPLILYPVDLYRKFGYSPPVGLFADKVNCAALREYLGHEDVAQLASQLRDLDEVNTRLEWFESQPDRADRDLEQAWHEFCAQANVEVELDDVEARLVLAKAHARALAWALNYIAAPETYEWVSEDLAERAVERIKRWSKEI